MSQQSRINFDQDTENVLNKLIHLYQIASESVQQMACHFLRDDVARRTFETLLWRRSDKLRVGQVKLVRFVNRRGGNVKFQDVPKPAQSEWKNMLECLQTLLNLEKQIFQVQQEVYTTAESKQDAVTQEYAEKKLMYKQACLIKKISTSIVTLQKNGEPIGDLLFEKHILEPVVVKETMKLMTKTPYVYPRYIKDQIICKPSPICPCRQ